jgi:hypothetical protein
VIIFPSKLVFFFIVNGVIINPNITFDNIIETIDDKRFKFEWYYLSQSEHITFDNIKTTIYDPNYKGVNPKFPWNWGMLSQNPNILRRH